MLLRIVLTLISLITSAALCYVAAFPLYLVIFYPGVGPLFLLILGTAAYKAGYFSSKVLQQNSPVAETRNSILLKSLPVWTFFLGGPAIGLILALKFGIFAFMEAMQYPNMPNFAPIMMLLLVGALLVYLAAMCVLFTGGIAKGLEDAQKDNDFEPTAPMPQPEALSCNTTNNPWRR